MLLNRCRICVITLLMSISLAYAEDKVPLCPSEIQVEQKVVLPNGSWKEYNSRPRHLFVNVVFTEGEPGRQVILVPTKQQKQERIQIDSWIFTPSETGYWISCEYTGTSMVLSKKLPANVRSCEVEYDLKFDTPVACHVICRP